MLPIASAKRARWNFRWLSRALLSDARAVAVLLLASKRFMGEALAVTNLVGNSVATIVVAKWEGALDEERMRSRLSLKRRNST